MKKTNKKFKKKLLLSQVGVLAVGIAPAFAVASTSGSGGKPSAINLATEIAKIPSSFTTTYNEDVFTANLPSGPNNVSNDFQNIEGFSLKSPFSIGVSITRVVVKTARNSKREVVYEVEITNSVNNVKETKDVTVTFARFDRDFSAAVGNFANFTTSDNSNSALAKASVGANVTVQFKTITGLDLSGLGPNAIVEKAIVKIALSGQKVIYTVVFAKAGAKETKDVIVTFARYDSDFSTAIGNFANFTTSDNSNSALAKASVGANVTAQFKTITSLDLSGLGSGVTVEKAIVKTALSGQNVVYTVVFAKGGAKETKDVTVTFAQYDSDFSAAVGNFADFTTSDNSNSALAKASVGADVTAQFKTITSLDLSGLGSGVTVEKAIVKTALSGQNVVYTVVFAKGGAKETKDVTVTFAQYDSDFSAAIGNFADFTTSDNSNSALAKASVGADVTAQFKTITGLDLSGLGSSATVEKAIVKTALSGQNVVYTIVFAKGGAKETKDVTVTFAQYDDALSTAVENFANFTTSDNSNLALAKAIVGADVTAQFKTITGLDLSGLGSSAIVEKAIVKTALSGQNVVYTIVFAKGGAKETKDVTVTFAEPTPESEKNKFRDFSSTDTVGSAGAILEASETDVKDKFIAIQGYASPTDLADGISISKVVVKTVLDPTSRQVVYVLTLAKKGQEPVEKEVTVTFAAINLGDEANKITSFASTDTVGSPLAILEVPNDPSTDEANIKATFEMIDGFDNEKAKLSKGVMIKRVVVKTALNPTSREVVYTVTFAYTPPGDEAKEVAKEKDVTVTFSKINIVDEVAKILDFNSADNTESEAAILKTSSDQTDIKTQFEAIDGYNAQKAKLSKGVIIQKAWVKTVLDESTRKVVYTAIFAYTLPSPSTEVNTEQKNITVTFAHTVASAVKVLEVANIVIADKATTLPSAISRETILNAIKKVETFVAMKEEARNNLIADNIELKANDDKGTLEVHVKDHGETKKLSLTGFKTAMKEKESSALSTGVLIGIIVGVGSGVGIIGYLIYYFLKNKK